MVSGRLSVGDSKAVVVSDDYQGYRHLDNEHQLCLAHILRELRDLVASDTLAQKAHARCAAVYETFAGIYADIEATRISSEPLAQHDALLNRLVRFAIPSPYDPLKLARVKAQVRLRTHNYLTCLKHPNVAADNNAAERSLRHLVIKRKTSFGSFCERTAETMAHSSFRASFLSQSRYLTKLSRRSVRGYIPAACIMEGVSVYSSDVRLECRGALSTRSVGSEGACGTRNDGTSMIFPYEL